MQRRSDLTMTDAELLALKGQLIKMEFQFDDDWDDEEIGIVTNIDVEKDEITIIRRDGHDTTWVIRGEPGDTDNVHFTTLED